MSQSTAKRWVAKLLDIAGVKIDGDRAFDIQVLNPDFYMKLLTGGSMALGESYMDGWWRCAALDQFFERIMSARLDQKARDVLDEVLFSNTGKRTIVMTTHNIERLNLSERIAILSKGKILYDKRSDQLTIDDFKRIYAEVVGDK